MLETQKKHSIPATFINLDKNATDIANEVFRFSSYPSHFILDPEGNLITGNIRSLNKEDAVAFIRTLIKK